jgi:hypothetical protein
VLWRQGIPVAEGISKSIRGAPTAPRMAACLTALRPIRFEKTSLFFARTVPEQTVLQCKKE